MTSAISTLFGGITTTSNKSVFKRVSQALSLHRQRRSLAQLDAQALRDIGITELEARQEASRPVWDAPDHFLK